MGWLLDDLMNFFCTVSSQGAKLILTEKVEQHRDEAESIVLEMAS